mmetsp:Transcript_17745/g.26474  ORF Transcript_17745/g.26474 Transcript_17745/m.26474 type:complete len:486 (-) Transcript_17745:2020-3477(-)
MTPRISSNANAAGTHTQENTNMLYQIDCCNAASGKTVCMTKRRVRWRFGTTNQDALEHGAVGVDCRGCESDILFSWSITSGKRMIVHDHKEVHYSQGKRAEGKFSFIWSAGGRMFTLVAYAAPPVQKTHRMCGKQFELLIDNIAFDSLPRIYELGMGMKNPSPRVGNSAMISGSAFAYPSISNSNSNSTSNNGGYARPERRCVQDEMTWARNVHTMETNRQMNSSAGGTRRTGATAACVEPSPRQGSSPVMQRKMNPNAAASNGTVVDLISDFTPSGAPRDLLSETVPIPCNAFATQPQQVPVQYDEFNPSTSAAPSYEIIWSSITGMNHSAAPNPATHNPVSSTGTFAMQHQSVSMHQVQSSMQNLYVDTNTFTKPAASAALVSPTEVSAIDGAMKNLVNMDDISRPVFQSYSKATKKNEWEGKENFPLRDLKRGVSTEKKEVMRTYEAYHQQQHQQPGALVVYGQQHGQQQQGPPPLSFGYRY